jgi:hypothetical protein
VSRILRSEPRAIICRQDAAFYASGLAVCADRHGFSQSSALLPSALCGCVLPLVVFSRLPSLLNLSRSGAVASELAGSSWHFGVAGAVVLAFCIFADFVAASASAIAAAAVAAAAAGCIVDGDAFAVDYIAAVVGVVAAADAAAVFVVAGSAAAAGVGTAEKANVPQPPVAYTAGFAVAPSAAVPAPGPAPA